MQSSTENKLLSMIPLIREFAVANRRTVSEITGPSRTHDLTVLRRDLIAQLYTEGFSASAIGRRMNRDHTTLLHHLGRLNRGRDVPRVEGPRA